MTMSNKCYYSGISSWTVQIQEITYTLHDIDRSGIHHSVPHLWRNFKKKNYKKKSTIIKNNEN